MENIEKDIEDLHPEEESKLKKKAKRIIMVFLALILLILILSYFLPGRYIPDIITGISRTYKVNNDDTIDFKGNKIIFNPDAYNQLLDIYFASQKTEFKVCLIGEKIDSDYLINSLYIPETLRQTVFSVHAIICNSSTIIDLHSHPYKRCVFSDEDINSYRKFRGVSKDGMIALMCEKDRFDFYKE